jgi:hypothetical protein
VALDIQSREVLRKRLAKAVKNKRQEYVSGFGLGLGFSLAEGK